MVLAPTEHNNGLSEWAIICNGKCANFTARKVYKHNPYPVAGRGLVTHL